MKRSFITLGLVTTTALSLLIAGCTVTARPATVHVASAYGGWSPTYYDGNLMYYSYSGRPYYYSNNIMVYVPSTWGHYDATVANWRTNQLAYNRWHARFHAPRFYTPARRAPARRPAVRPRPAPRPVIHVAPVNHGRPARDDQPDPRLRHKR